MANKNLWRGSILVKLQALKVKPLEGYFISLCSSYFYLRKKTIRMKSIEKKKKIKNICKRVSFFHGFIFQGSCLQISKKLFFGFRVPILVVLV